MVGSGEFLGVAAIQGPDLVAGLDSGQGRRARTREGKWKVRPGPKIEAPNKFITTATHRSTLISSINYHASVHHHLLFCRRLLLLICIPLFHPKASAAEESSCLAPPPSNSRRAKQPPPLVLQTFPTKDTKSSQRGGQPSLLWYGTFRSLQSLYFLLTV